MNYCYQCGAKLPDNAVFCGQCGTKQKNVVKDPFSAIEKPRVKTAAPVMKPNEKKKKKKGGKFFLILLILIVMFLLLKYCG